MTCINGLRREYDHPGIDVDDVSVTEGGYRFAPVHVSAERQRRCSAFERAAHRGPAELGRPGPGRSLMHQQHVRGCHGELLEESEKVFLRTSQEAPGVAHDPRDSRDRDVAEV